MVLYLLLGPTVAEFHGKQRTFCYALAVAHLLLTLITKNRLGIFKTLPMVVHGAIELLIAVLLLALPWIADFAAGVHSRNFFILTGMIMLIICAMSDYRGGAKPPVESKDGVGR